MIKSMLETDQYKITMGQVAMRLFPDAKAQYTFFNRGAHIFDEEFVKMLKTELSRWDTLYLTNTEAFWLKKNLPFLSSAYIEFLRGYRYNTNYIKVGIEDGQMALTITGPWYSTIHFEVALMATISELYFKYHSDGVEFVDDYDMCKANCLKNAGAKFADFGTRRRFSSVNHDRVVKIFKKCDAFVGTSNLHLAHEHMIKPIGTCAHEFFQFHEAKYGIRHCTEAALENWVQVYQGDLGIALTDTFTTDHFLKSFGKKYAMLFTGVRHDSGDPFEFTEKIISHYESLGIDPTTKTIVYSDGLTVDKVEEIEAYVNGRIKTSYGLGTNFSNDVGVRPLNIVIKMTACAPDGKEWVDVAKLSDDVGKHTGNKDKIDSLLRDINA